MEKKLRVGIIGCGGIAENKHLPALKTIPEVEFAAFCDIIPERAEKCAKEYAPDAKTFKDYKEMLKEVSLDVVHVLTPNSSHSELTVAALEAGAHVMCEKPMAINSKEAQLMLDASKKTGKLLTIGYHSRYRGNSMYLKEMCENDELGEIYYARAHAIRRRAVPTWGVFLNKELQGGGPLIDIGTHALDLTLWCMNNYEPEMVTGNVFYKLGKQENQGNAWGSWDTETFDVEDSAVGFIRMKNGAVVTLEASWALNSLDVRESECTLCGTKAGADFVDGLRINSVKHNRQTIEIPSFKAGGAAFFSGSSGSKPELAEARVWIDAVLGKGETIVKPEQAIVVTKILEAIYESAKTGKPVYFD